MKSNLFRSSYTKYALLGLITVLAASCFGVANQPPTLTASPTITATQTLINQTPTEITPPTFTAEPALTVYDFPTWMSDPNTNILAALTTEDSYKVHKISFFNAATGEKYEIVLSEDVNGFFWYDNTNFGLLANELQTAYKINLQTGKASMEKISPQSTQLLSKESRHSTLAIIDKLSGTGVTFDYDDYWDRGEWKNRAFKVLLSDSMYGGNGYERTLTVYGTKTNQAIWKVTLPQDRFITEFIWSPVNENLLAFLEGSATPAGFITESMKLNVVDVSQGKILFTYDNDDFGETQWSPDGQMILYLDSSYRYRGYGRAFTEAPCILFWETGKKRCLDKIPNIIPAGYKLETTGVYQWSKDSQSIFYTYEYVIISDHYEMLGNLCVYRLIEDSIHCPTQDLEALRKRSALWYDISPDERFIYFCYSDASIMNDYADESSDGIIGIDGSGFFSWVGASRDYLPKTQCSGETLWRPLP